MLSELLSRAYGAEEVESLVAARALLFAGEIGVDNIILEGDSSNVIKALQGEEQSLLASGLLIEDVKLLSGCFSKLLYFHTKRDGNKLAHSLARCVVNVSSFLVWSESIPPIFSTVFQANLASFS